MNGIMVSRFQFPMGHACNFYFGGRLLSNAPNQIEEKFFLKTNYLQWNRSSKETFQYTPVLYSSIVLH